MAYTTKSSIGTGAQRPAQGRPAAGRGADACDRPSRQGSGRADRGRVHGRQLPRGGARGQRGGRQGQGACRWAAGRLSLAAQAAGAGHGLCAHQAPLRRQGRRSGGRLQSALGAQLVDGLHRQPRLHLPVEGRARPAAPRGHPVHRRAGARTHGRAGLARGRGRLGQRRGCLDQCVEGPRPRARADPRQAAGAQEGDRSCHRRGLGWRRRQRHPHAGCRLWQRAHPPRRCRARRCGRPAQRHADRPRRRRRLCPQAGLPRRCRRSRLCQRSGRRDLARHPRGTLEGHQVAQRRRRPEVAARRPAIRTSSLPWSSAA